MAEMATSRVELHENLQENNILCLLEGLQNDTEGFDELIFEHETNQTENQVIPETEIPTVASEPELSTLALQPELLVPEPELSTLNHEPESQTLPTANEQVPASNVQENNKPARFKTAG
jgi:hypothetical protein